MTLLSLLPGNQRGHGPARGVGTPVLSQRRRPGRGSGGTGAPQGDSPARGRLLWRVHASLVNTQMLNCNFVEFIL